MKKKIATILFLGICLVGCEKSYFNIKDQNYPTTIKKVSPDKLAQLRSEYFQKNTFIYSSLNEFGYCGTDNTDRDVDKPQNPDIITQEEAINIVKDFVLNNMQETGITSINDIQFKKINAIHGSNSDSSSHWYLSVKNQMVDSLEVLDTGIGFRIINGKIVHCANNWYPEVYIPKEFNFSSEKAKSSLVNQVVLIYGFAGSYEVTITQEDINKSSAKLVIRHIAKDDKIELVVDWKVMIPRRMGVPVYVDVMTGEINEESDY